MDGLEIVFRRLTAEDARPPFDCKDKDLNEFFFKDSKDGCKELVSVTYCVEREGVLLAYFCVSNDSIRSKDTSNRNFDRIRSLMTPSKQYPSMPAVKIGRLAVSALSKRNGVGTAILDLIKVWFTKGNKTGCRFIIVDALNNNEALGFYKKNGFDFLDSHRDTEDRKTRLMYFDLYRFATS